MRILAARLHCTEGQAYTLVIGMVFALVLAFTGVQPALRRPASASRAEMNAAIPIPDLAEREPASMSRTATTRAPISLPAPQAVAVFRAPAHESRRAPAAVSSTQPTTRSPADLRVTDAAYARAVGGAGVGDLAVPEGGLPVGARAGKEDARTYLRLEGERTALRVVVHPDDSGSIFPDQAAILACRVTTTDWELEDGSSIERAPAIDTDGCVPGAPVDDGAWAFELAPLGRVTATGVALVPVLDGGSTFQVTFSIDAE